MAGHRIADPPIVPDDVRADYTAFVHRLLTSDYCGNLHLSDKAMAIYEEFVRYNDAGKALRIAGLLHAANATDDPTKTLISDTTMLDAMRLNAFFADSSTNTEQLGIWAIP
jgi:hypothetical protein